MSNERDYIYRAHGWRIICLECLVLVSLLTFVLFCFMSKSTSLNRSPKLRSKNRRYSANICTRRMRWEGRRTKGSDRSSTFVIHRSNVYLGSSNRRLYDFHLQLYTWFPHGNAPSFVLDCHCVINTSFGHVDNKSEIWLLMVGARVFGNCESVVRLNDEGLGTRFVVIRQSKFPDVWEARRVCRGIASPPNERCVNETVRLWPISRYRVLHPQIP